MTKARRIVVMISGASGRMGRALLKLVLADSTFHLIGGLVRADSSARGADLGTLAGLPPCGIVAQTRPAPAMLAETDLLIDFSHPDQTRALLAPTIAAGVALLVGTTGLDMKAQRAVRVAARRIPLLTAANTALGMNVLFHLVEQAARMLPDAWHAEIFEAHHAGKIDAPSGSALALSGWIARGRGRPLANTGGDARWGRGRPREKDEVGFAVMRGGDVVGEHRVFFLGAGERIELAHQVNDRDIFARGALAAGRWLVDQKPGLYGMRDFLGGALEQPQTRQG
ncbi:MAG TPA: 4-hydroxy-tetrahydrodipicolinate reductase [Dongiaceae bacterium]|jgi:4-hydroxy-tetrahydrodipicolinate reductase|nr:4-hydroxy-tetrahydrodipicolinate reductase [Dongiaceae bacterium]